MPKCSYQIWSIRLIERRQFAISFDLKSTAKELTELFAKVSGNAILVDQTVTKYDDGTHIRLVFSEEIDYKPSN